MVRCDGMCEEGEGSAAPDPHRRHALCPGSPFFPDTGSACQGMESRARGPRAACRGVELPLGSPAQEDVRRGSGRGAPNVEGSHGRRGAGNGNGNAPLARGALQRACSMEPSLQERARRLPEGVPWAAAGRAGASPGDADARAFEGLALRGMARGSAGTGRGAGGGPSPSSAARGSRALRKANTSLAEPRRGLGPSGHTRDLPPLSPASPSLRSPFGAQTGAAGYFPEAPDGAEFVRSSSAKEPPLNSRSRGGPHAAQAQWPSAGAEPGPGAGLGTWVGVGVGAWGGASSSLQRVEGAPRQPSRGPRWGIPALDIPPHELLLLKHSPLGSPLGCASRVPAHVVVAVTGPPLSPLFHGGPSSPAPELHATSALTPALSPALTPALTPALNPALTPGLTRTLTSARTPAGRGLAAGQGTMKKRPVPRVRTLDSAWGNAGPATFRGTNINGNINDSLASPPLGPGAPRWGAGAGMHPLHLHSPEEGLWQQHQPPRFVPFSDGASRPSLGAPPGATHGQGADLAFNGFDPEVHLRRVPSYGRTKMSRQAWRQGSGVQGSGKGAWDPSNQGAPPVWGDQWGGNPLGRTASAMPDLEWATHVAKTRGAAGGPPQAGLPRVSSLAVEEGRLVRRGSLPKGKGALSRENSHAKEKAAAARASAVAAEAAMWRRIRRSFDDWLGGEQQQQELLQTAGAEGGKARGDSLQEGEAAQSLGRPEDIGRLLDTITFGKGPEREGALRSLRCAVTGEEGEALERAKAELVRMGAVECLLDVVSGSPEGEASEHALATLFHLLAHRAPTTPPSPAAAPGEGEGPPPPGSRAALASRDVVRLGGVALLVQVLIKGSPAAQASAAACMFALCRCEDVRARLREAGAVSPLLRVLERGDARGKKDAALALFGLSLHPSGAQDLVQAGAVPLLLRCIGEEGCPGLDGKVSAVLRNVARHAEGARALARAGGAGAVVDFLEQGMSSGAREDAAGLLLLLLSSGAVSAQELVDEGALPSLVHVSQSAQGEAAADAKALLQLLRKKDGQ